MNTLRLKTLRDMWLYKARTALVVSAIAVGTAAAGVATTSFIVLRGDLRDGYLGTNPAHAVLDVTGIDVDMAARVAALPEIDAAEARRFTPAELILPDGEERFLQLWTLPDFDAATVGVLYRQPGAVVPPPVGSVLLERSAAPALGITMGDTLAVRLLDGTTASLIVAGFINDMAVAPTTVQPSVYAYMTDDTAARLGLPEAYNQLALTVSAANPDRAAVEAAVTAATAWLESEGVIVTRADIPQPNVHIMQGSVDTGLLMIGILGGLMLLLSAFLVTNVMSAVVAQQVPVIGVLKALGGGRRLVAWQYGRMVLWFGLMALAVAVPLGLVGAWFQSSYLAGQLNYDIPSFGLQWPTVVVQAAGALLIPALAALGPVRSAARMTIREALSPVGEVAGKPRRPDAFDTRFAERPSYLLAWRNVARRPVRLALTLIALSLAGAMFVATFGLKLGLDEAIEILVGEFPYDVVIDFAGPEQARRVEREAAGIPGIERLEAWGVADARRVYPDGRVGSSFTLYGVPPTTRIAPYAEREGRWLDDGAAGDAAELYINYETEKLAARPAVGDTPALRLNGTRDATARLVGISSRPFNADAYMTRADFERATGERGRAGRVVVYLSGDNDGGAAVAANLVARYEAAGMTVARAETTESFRRGYAAQFNTLVMLLMALAGLTALVGGLGLANTMALNVLERSREIGLLRSMGAERGLLRRLVLAEGLAIAVVGGVVGLALAVPMTLALDRVMGGTLLGSPLSFAYSPAAAAGWLALVVAIGLAACWVPAAAAARMTVRAAVGYE